MAALNFPSAPEPGQVYPDPKIEGVKQWAWDSTKGTWTITSDVVVKVLPSSPVTVEGAVSTPIVGMPAATSEAPGYMSAADKAKLDALPDPTLVSQPPVTWARLDDISPLFNSVRPNFPLTANGVLVTPPSSSSVMVVMESETLTPFVDYQVSGSQIIFTTSPHRDWTFSGVALI